LRLRAGGWRERRRERRGVGREPDKRDRPRKEVAGAGDGRSHGRAAAATWPGGQMVFQTQPGPDGPQRCDGHHQRQRTGVPVDSRRWARGRRRARPAQRSDGRRHRGDAARRQVRPAPGHPGRTAYRRADRRVQVSGGGLERGTPIRLAPNGRI